VSTKAQQFKRPRENLAGEAGRTRALDSPGPNLTSVVLFDRPTRLSP
jgi:hypothetical protein